MMWLIFTALLAAALNPQSRATVTFASTCWVKGQPNEELVLHCGDGEHEGVVQFWHTPFGDLQTGSQSKLDTVFMHHDGSLVIPNSSIHHGGLYYCVLRQVEGSTLWPFELHVDQNMAAEVEDGRGGGGGCACAARRFRRNAAFPGEREAVISDEIFAGAVAGSVLLTFVVGFSAGALSRTHVLRCLKSLGPKQRRSQPDEPDGSRVTMTTLPPVYDNQAFRTGAMPHDPRLWRSTETPTPLTTPSPPAKPKRSFRLNVEEKEEEQPERTAYLEGCDSDLAEEETGSGEDGEAKEEEENTKPDEKEDDEERETEEGEEEEEVGEEEKQKTDESEELEQESRGKDDERSVKAEAESGGEDPPSGSPRRRSRVIRLYQYDEDGQRYGHLPDPEAPEPAPRPRQRSRSLTRLNAIMAAAATGPMERSEPEEKQHFHMDI